MLHCLHGAAADGDDHQGPGAASVTRFSPERRIEMTCTPANSRVPEEASLAVGDTVRLKSGDHLMTIIGIVPDSVECA